MRVPGGHALRARGAGWRGLAGGIREAWTKPGTTNKFKGVVLDLRYAGGDDYAAAAAAADLFVKKEQSLLNWGNGMVRSKPKSEAIKVPVAVLVNRRRRARRRRWRRCCGRRERADSGEPDGGPGDGGAGVSVEEWGAPANRDGADAVGRRLGHVGAGGQAGYRGGGRPGGGAGVLRGCVQGAPTRQTCWPPPAFR